METTSPLEAADRTALVDALCVIVTTPELAVPSPRLDRAVERWSRGVPAPADVLGLVADVRLHTRGDRSRRHVEVLHRAEVVGVAAIARRQVHDALTDALTGLATRARLEDEAQHLIAVAARTGSPLTAVMLDVDGLKQINDAEGHAAGDAAIAEVGRAVRSHLRRTDRAFRYGGDEFVVLLPGTTAEGARALVQRIQGGCSVRVSAGVAAHSGFPLDTDVAAWLSKADTALYDGRTAHRRTTASCSSPSQRLPGAAGTAAAALLFVAIASGAGLLGAPALQALAGRDAPHGTPASPAAAAPAGASAPVPPITHQVLEPSRAPVRGPVVVAPVRRTIVVGSPAPVVAAPLPTPLVTAVPTPLPTLPAPTTVGRPTVVPVVVVPVVAPAPSVAPTPPGLVGGLLHGVGGLLHGLL